MADGTTGDSRSGRGERTGGRRAASPAKPKRPTEARPRTKRTESRGRTRPGTIPAPTIVSDGTAGGRLGLVQELISAYRRDPTGSTLNLLIHAGVLLAWIVFFFLTFSLGVVAYNYVFDKDPAMEFGWLSEEEVSASRPNDGPVKLDGFPVRQPSSSDPSDTDSEPTDGDPGGGSGETEAKPVDVRGLLRDRENWELAINAVGGNDETRAAIDRGLNWLARQQHTDGHWQFSDPTKFQEGSDWVDWKTHTGATSIALLAFLGAGNTQDNGDHQKTVEKGLDWLIAKQKRRGDDAGDFFDHQDYGRAPHYFAHSMATIAICEAYALTGDAELREPAERAVAFLIRSQHPTKGGWGYMSLRDEDAEAYMWVTGWGLMAMFTARAAGIEIDREDFQRTSRFVDSVMIPEGRGYKNRSHDGDPPRASLLAEGLLARQYLGWERDHPALRNGLEVMRDPANLPAWEPGRRDLYAWYHEAEVLHNMGGDEFDTWYARVQRLVVDNQQKGSRRPPDDTYGSWHPTEPRGPVFEVQDDKLGRLYSTCMCLLILESPFRHMPVYPPEGDEVRGTRVE